MTQIAVELGRLVQHRHVSVSNLADAAGIDASTIYKWLNGQTRPSFQAIAMIARHCDVPEVESALVRCLIGERGSLTVALDAAPPRGEICRRAIHQMISMSASLQALSVAPNPRAYASLHRDAQRDAELALRALGHTYRWLIEQAPKACNDAGHVAATSGGNGAGGNGIGKAKRRSA